MSLTVIKYFKPFLIIILLSVAVKVSAAVYTPYNSGLYNAANLRVDSLRNLLATSKENPTDTITINRVNKLAAEFVDVNPDSTLYYARLAINRSLAIKYKIG